MANPEPHRLVTRLALVEGVTRTGDAVTLVALPLTTVLVLDATPGQLALIGFAQAVPILALASRWAWVDRQRRRRPFLILADLVRAGLLALVPITAAAGLLTAPLLALIAFPPALPEPCSTSFAGVPAWSRMRFIANARSSPAVRGVRRRAGHRRRTGIDVTAPLAPSLTPSRSSKRPR
jgi:hypothetical protein